MVEVMVDGVRLDKILAPYQDIKLVKIDVEGAEFKVLKGMERILNKIKYVIVEISSNLNDILTFMSQKGFSYKELSFTTYFLFVKQ